MAKKQLLEDIKLEPTRIFRAPGDVLRDRRFSDQERLDILTAWEAIARAVKGNSDDHARLSAIVATRAEVEFKLSANKMSRSPVP